MTNKKHLCMQFYQPSPFKYLFWFYKRIIHSPCLPCWEKESCNLLNYFVSQKTYEVTKETQLFNTYLYYILCKKVVLPIQYTREYHTTFLILNFGSLKNKTALIILLFHAFGIITVLTLKVLHSVSQLKTNLICTTKPLKLTANALKIHISEISQFPPFDKELEVIFTVSRSQIEEDNIF